MQAEDAQSTMTNMTSANSPSELRPAASPAGLALRPATPNQLAWLRTEAAHWQEVGLLDAATTEQLLARYSAHRSLSLGRLVLALGACFFGVGLIWLVASNLEGLSPVLRFSAVALIWLLALLGSEGLHARGVSPVVVGAGRTLAAFAVGALIFQAAQSLQVPAYDAGLVGAWGAAALLHAYATRARGPLLVGVAASAGWSIWHGAGDSAHLGDLVWAFALTGLLMVAAAALHRGAWAAFAPAWRTVGSALALVGLFIACLPAGDSLHLSFGLWPLLLASGAAVATLLVLARGTRLARAEVLVVSAAVLASLAMTAWEAAESGSPLTTSDVLHAIAGVLLYVGLAVAIAVSGTLRDAGALTAIATAGLVVFTTFQSFAVFGEIIEGAWLFLVLGLVFLATGLGFDRARRRLASRISAEQTEGNL